MDGMQTTAKLAHFHDILFLQDGPISCGENCGLCVLGLLSGVLGIAALVTLIWVGRDGYNLMQ